jgi:hypothetical protein
MSRGTQLHANVFDGRYPELRVYDCLGVRRVDPLADIEGITVFKLLPLCGVFMELFDRLTLSSPPFRQFRRVATEIVSGKQPSMAELNTSLKSEYIPASYQP